MRFFSPTKAQRKWIVGSGKWVVLQLSLATSHLPLPTYRKGYVFLISVLVTGVIAASTAVSLVLLGLASKQSSQSMQFSTQAFELAQTCAERALRSLRADTTYDGNETFTLTGGSCTINTIGGSGTADRDICVTGRSGTSTKRIQLDVPRLFPTVHIVSWKEVASFSLCP